MMYHIYMQNISGEVFTACNDSFVDSMKLLKEATRAVYAVARLFDDTGDEVAEMVGHELRRPVYCVVNGNTGCNLTKKNSRDVAENSAMRWRQTLKALEVPVYVINSLTGEIVYEAL